MISSAPCKLNLIYKKSLALSLHRFESESFLELENGLLLLNLQTMKNSKELMWQIYTCILQMNPVLILYPLASGRWPFSDPNFQLQVLACPQVRRENQSRAGNGNCTREFYLA